MLFSLGSISFSVGPLCISLINAWISHAGSRHSLTLPFALGTNTRHTPICHLVYPKGCDDVHFLQAFQLLLEWSLYHICHMSGSCLVWLAVGLKLQWKCAFKEPNTIKTVTKGFVYLMYHGAAFSFICIYIIWWIEIINWLVWIVLVIFTIGILLHNYTCIPVFHVPCLFCTLLSLSV